MAAQEVPKTGGREAEDLTPRRFTVCRESTAKWYDARLVQLGWNVTFEFRVHHEKQ